MNLEAQMMWDNRLKNGIKEGKFWASGVYKALAGVSEGTGHCLQPLVF